MLEEKDWKVALEIYARHEDAALALAYQLFAIKQSLERGRKGIRDATEGLELAIETLFPHTRSYKMGHKLYRRTIEGKITPEQQEKQIRKLSGRK